jgi:hypothetical protein
VLALGLFSHRLARAQCADYGTGIRWLGTVPVGGFHENSGHSIALNGPYIYAALVEDWTFENHFGFAILDLAGNILGRCPLAGEPRAVSVGGTPLVGGPYAYVTVNGYSRGALQVIDVSDPAAPRSVQTVDTPGLAYDVEVDGRYAYVADGQYGVQVVDVLYPPLARIVGSVDTPGVARGVSVAEPWAYVADGESGLQVMDVSDPTLPKIVGSVDTSDDTPGLANDVAIAGSYVYVANGGHDPGYGYSNGFVVVDVSNPHVPVVVPFTDPPQPVEALGFTLADSRLYVAGYTGLVVFDVSAPDSPRFLGRNPQDYGAFGVVVAGNRAYVAAGGLDILDVSDPTSTPRVDAVWFGHAGYEASDFAFSDPYIYVADGGADDGNWHVPGGLRILERSTGRAVGSVAAPVGFTAYAVAVAGTHAYLAGYGQLLAVDVSNPSSPAIVGDLGLGGFRIAVVDTCAYLSTGDSLRVLDISSPASPRLVHAVASLARIDDFVVHGSYLYVLAAFQGLLVFDISDPVSPSLVGSFPLESPWGTLDISGSYAYISANAALTVVDVSDPAAPTLAGRSSRLRSGEIVVSGSFAYIRAGEEVEIVDVSNPASPIGVGRVDVTSSSAPRGFATDGTHVYVGFDEGHEVRALPLQCEHSTPVFVSDLAAEPRKEGVIVRWHATGSDLGVFEVFRAPGSDPAPGLYLRIGSAESAGPNGAWQYLDATALPGAIYAYCVQWMSNGVSERFGPIVTRALSMQGVTLGPVSPSPARESTTVSFSLSYAQDVRLEVYDARGRQIRVLSTGVRHAGFHAVVWDGRDARGVSVGSGFYFVRLTAPGYSSVQRCAFLR